MTESVILLAMVILVRTANQVVAWLMSVARERARNRDLAAVLRTAEPGSVVVDWRTDRQILIICSHPGGPIGTSR